MAFSLNGRSICKKFWCEAYNISSYQYKYSYEIFKNKRQPQFIHGNKGLSNKTSIEVEAFVDYWLRIFAEPDPATGIHHFPPWCNEETIVEEAKLLNITITVPQVYYCLSKKENLVFPRKIRLGICDLCSTYSEKISRLPKEKQEELCNSRKLHIELVNYERKQYQIRKIQAKAHPIIVTSLIFDAMTPTILPSCSRPPKFFLNIDRLKLKVYGLINHSSEERSLYVFPDVWPSDSNVTCSILTLHILHLHQQQKLGKELYVQLDNCFRENKNQFVISFFGLLVQLKIFTTIQISFLPPGHTHEDVDQMFSTFSLGKQKENIFSPQDLQNFITTSYTDPKTRPVLYWIKNVNSLVWNFKKMLPEITIQQGLSKQRFFKLYQQDNQIQICWKDKETSNWSNTELLFFFSPDINNLSLAPIERKNLPSEVLESLELPKMLDLIGEVQSFQFYEFYRDPLAICTTPTTIDLKSLQPIQPNNPEPIQDEVIINLVPSLVINNQSLNNGSLILNQVISYASTGKQQFGYGKIKEIHENFCIVGLYRKKKKEDSSNYSFEIGNKTAKVFKQLILATNVRAMRLKNITHEEFTQTKQQAEKRLTDIFQTHQ